MDKKQILKDVLDLCKQGKLKAALSILCKIDGEVNNKWIMAVIIGCCNTCIANNSTPENISEQDLYNLLTLIVSYIKYINEADLLSYLQSLFHILKFFVNKKAYQLIAKMRGLLVPSFLPSSLSKKHSDTYQSSASLLHNLIARSVGYDEFDSLIEICNIISNMYAAVSNYSALLSMSFNCAIRLSQLPCPIKEQEAYYFNVLSLTKLETIKVNTEEDFKSFLSHFTLLFDTIFKNFEFKQAANFYKRAFKSGIEIFNNSDCINILTLLRFPLVISPFAFEDKLASLMKCKRSLSNLESAEQKQIAGNKLHSLIHTIVYSYYKSVNGSEWCKLSEICQLEILQFIWEIAKLELLSKYSCSCKCLIDKNVYQAFTYSQYISTLLEICVRQKNVSSDFNKEGVNLLLRFCENIRILKEYNCEKWKAAWNSLGMAIYNIGVHLYQNSDQGCLGYFYSLIKYYIKFEYYDAMTILKFSIISSAFAVVCNYSLGDYKKCMALSALAIKLCPNQRSSLITNWIKAKVSQRDAKTFDSSEAQKVTLVSVFKQFKKEIEFLTDGSNLLTVSDKIDLLVFELEHYKSKWKSKVPMMSALKELCEVANLNKIVEVIINIFGDCELMLHDDVPKILQKTLKQYEEKITRQENPTSESTVFLAALYYMHYKYCVKDTITKNTNDMERTMSVVTQKPDEPPDAIPKDPNEECDIVSSYDSLKLNRYFGVMKYLNKSLNLFASVIKDNFDFSSLTKITTSLLYNLLLKISFEYRLHRYRVKCLQSLQLALKVAQFDNSACNIVWAIGFIIENSDIRNYVKYLMLIADKQLSDIECTSIPNLKVIITYYICKAKYLLYQDYKEAYRIFKMANELYDIQDDKSELQLIKSQLHLLHFKFVLLPCEFGIVDHKKSTLLTIHLANATVYEVYNASKLDGSYEMSVLLDANEELAKLHHFLRCPREVRSYCRETIILAQQLVLPIRCAYYLVYLAHADLRSSRYDDCQVKINGLADILCLTKHNLQIDQENKPPLCTTEIEKDIIGITGEMQEMVLDLPVPNRYKKQFSPSSPTLIIQPFNLPAFVHHEDDCDCFYCISLEYQNLVLEKIRLDALLNVKQDNNIISIDFFHGALNFYEQCYRKYESHTETIANFISYDLIPEFAAELMGAYGFTLLDYSYHLMRTKNETEALQITNRLIDLVLPRKLQHIYLYNEALLQKLGYLTEIPVAPIACKAPEMESLCPETNIISTTPESKHSKVTFSVQYTPSFSPPKRRVKKCLPFNLSPNQDSSNDNETQEKAASISKPKPKTPAPKIKIYSSNGTAQKSKNAPATIHIFNDGGKRNKKKGSVSEDSGFNITSTATLSTPIVSQPLNSQLGLRTRTKILTEKLKQSTKKPEVPAASVVNDRDEVEVSNGKKKLSLRKNLFDEGKLEKDVNVPQGGAIRKTTRTRKVK